MTTVTLADITQEYVPGIPVLTDLNLEINTGELVALLGPSGSGKTTVLRLIAGLLAPTRGDIRFNGQSVRNIPPEKRGTVMVFQNHAIFPFMSVGENVAFGLKVRKLNKVEISKRVTEALAAVQLAGFEDRHPTELSGGQQQRVALARALVVQPNMLLLDEPLSNLEPGLRVEMREMIRSLQKDVGITTLFVTHDQEEAITIADRVALLLEGRLRQVGPPRSFFERPANSAVHKFFGGSNLIAGTKCGSRVQTAFGELEIAAIEWPDGNVQLTIHPEAIEIGANGHNNISAQIASQKYLGPKIAVDFLINGHTLKGSVPSEYQYTKNTQVVIHLPKDRIHLIPCSPKELQNELSIQ